MTIVANPYSYWTNLLGLPLDFGYIYIGADSADPETTSAPVFWDEALTIPAAQPLRTVAGYIVNAGSPAAVYTAGDYSIRVRQPLGLGPGAVVFYDAHVEAEDGLAELLAGPGGAALIGTAGGGTVQDYLNSALTLKSDGATGDGTTNDTVNLQSVLDGAADGSVIEAPTGDYLTNGNSFVAGRAFRLTGTGKATMRPNGTGVLMTVPNDPTLLEGVQRIIEGVRFLGAAAAEPYTYTAGTTGLRWGVDGVTNPSVINPVTRDCVFKNLEVGLHHVASQETLDSNNLHYRNYIGQLIQADSVNGGGATASLSFHVTYQYNVIGVFANNALRTSLCVNGTLTSGAVTVANCDTTAGVVAGLKVLGPGIPQGATVAGNITGTGFDLSAAALQSIVNVPLLATNNGGYGTGWRWDGVSTFQGNSHCALAMFGFDGVVVGPGTHFETNHITGTPASITYQSRVIPAVPLYLYDTVIEFDGTLLSESWNGVGIDMVAGSRVRFEDCSMPGTTVPLRWDGTCDVKFFGHALGSLGQWLGNHNRWPDSISFSGAFQAIGDPSQVRSRAIPNQSANINPRIPVLTPNGGTVSTAVDADGVWVSAAFTGVGSSSNSVIMALLDGVTSIGDQIGFWLVLKADRYTRLTVQVTNGIGSVTFANIPVTPFPQRLFSLYVASAAQTGVQVQLYPTGADNPTFKLRDEMQVRVGPNGSIVPISEVMAHGLFDPKSDDGAFIGKITTDLASVAAGGISAVQTITVPGAQLGNRAAVACSIDGQGIDFPAWVQAANTVKFYARNPTAGAIDLASADYTARVLS